MFREGFEFPELCISEGEGRSISDKIDAHCKAQAVHFLRDEPVEPIAIYGEVRSHYQATARRFEKAIADYERIRLLFGFLMWGWAALELAGLVLLFGIARADLARLRRRRAARRSGGG